MRKTPKQSATKFKIGTIKKGVDKNYWVIIKIKNGVIRWQKFNKTKRKSKYYKKLEQHNKLLNKIKLSNFYILKNKLSSRDKYYLTPDNGGKSQKQVFFATHILRLVILLELKLIIEVYLFILVKIKKIIILII